LDEIKSANSDGRFWIRLDATDVKRALMESGRKVWNGDVDMSNGLLQKMREEYEQRLEMVNSVTSVDATKQDIIVTIQKMVDDLEVDSEFLKVGLEEARKVFQEKFKKHGTSGDT